jgi:transposase
LRQQLLDQRKALQAQGRSLLWEFGYLQEGQSPWWEESVWAELPKTVAPTVVSNLGRLRAVLEQVDQQLSELMVQLRQQATEVLPRLLPQLPRGLGWLSLLILTREIMNWKRFGNRRQVGCLTGLVPSEASTGQSRRLGSVTKVGNPRIRAVLVEMAWRLKRYQPRCHALRGWLPVLQDRQPGRASARKRAIVAVARVLAIDLWRLMTGQTTAAQLGFRV